MRAEQGDLDVHVDEPARVDDLEHGEQDQGRQHEANQDKRRSPRVEHGILYLTSSGIFLFSHKPLLSTTQVLRKSSLPVFQYLVITLTVDCAPGLRVGTGRGVGVAGGMLMQRPPSMILPSWQTHLKDGRMSSEVSSHCAYAGQGPLFRQGPVKQGSG